MDNLYSKFADKFKLFEDEYISTFTTDGGSGEILFLYQDNFGCQQFKDFYFLGKEIMKRRFPCIHNNANRTLEDTYKDADFDIYSNVWYPNGITEDDMDNFEQLMKACVHIWADWCRAVTCSTIHKEHMYRMDKGHDISMNDKNSYNDAHEMFKKLNLN